MAVIKKKHQVLKKKKKNWFSLLGPKLFGNNEMGEAYVSESKELIDKNVVLSLSALGKVRNNNVSISMRITDVKDGKGVSEIIGYSLSNAYVKRVVRKNKTKITGSYKLKSKDNKDINVKAILVTRSKINSGVSRDLKKKLDEFILNEFSKSSFDKSIEGLVSHETQNNMKKLLSKVYPLSIAEIRFFKRN